MTTYNQSFLRDIEELAAVQENHQATSIKNAFEDAQNLLTDYGQGVDGTLIAAIQGVDLDRVSAAMHGYIGGFLGREAMVRDVAIQIARITGFRKAAKDMSEKGLITHRTLRTLEYVNKERQVMLLWMTDRAIDQRKENPLQFDETHGYH